jgi:hypothetical protein
VSTVEKLWKQQSSNEPFEYVFLDENFDRLLIFSGLTAIIIAWLTVSYQSVKTASSNPVDSLRYE